MGEKINKIQVIEKPDYISWEEIHNVLWLAHEKNREKGMVMRYPSLTGEELEKKIGKNGQTFVALDGDVVVGTCSYKLVQRNNWYTKGKKTAYFLMTSVLPEYQGSNVYFKLVKYRLKFIEDINIEVAYMDTAENNIIMQKILLKQGYKYVGFGASSYSNHYYVVMAKWFKECPFSDKYINCRFKISRALTKVQYKPGKIEHSRVLSLFCKAANKIINFVF